MISFAALYFATTLLVLISAACHRPLSCPCGGSNKNYTLCLDDIKEEKYPCKRWSQCLTCKDNTHHCVTCPLFRSGADCSKVSIDGVREQKPRRRFTRQYSTRNMSQYLPGWGANRSYSTRGPQYELQQSNGQQFNEQQFNQQQFNQQQFNQQQFNQQQFNQRPSGIQKERHSGCPYPGEIPNGRIEDHPLLDPLRRRYHFPSGTIFRYICNDGYSMESSDTISCNGRSWVGDMPVCRPQVRNPDEQTKSKCPDPGRVGGADRVTGYGVPVPNPREFEERESVIFTCSGRGMALEGSPILICGSDGKWSDLLPQCIFTRRTVTCPDPGSVENADKINTDRSPTVPNQAYSPTQSVVFTCRSGYLLQGQSMLRCLQTGRWSHQPPVCISKESPDDDEDGVAYCDHPEVDINADIDDSLLDARKKTRFRAGARVKYSCRRGFILKGERILYCLATGQWSDPAPRCVKRKQPEPEEPEEFHDFPTEETEETSTEEPSEIKVSCPPPGINPNSRMEDHPLFDPRRRNDRLPYGTELTYTCDDGYDMEGSNVIFCLPTGTWSANPPSCIQPPAAGPATSCASLRSVAKGRVVGYKNRPPDGSADRDAEYPVGTELQYFCEDGYALQGADNLQCLDSGVWSAETPTCVEGIL